ncbi:MAG: hypothetical protein A2293_05060 [Elusimicrobia bacterium RIFOXYB2_FULL_49_7]|nr:MAG: hypothetical protein A2293_05060 [Elusimicrobia bacterium RIFOXYB2_FULL_49_7]
MHILRLLFFAIAVLFIRVNLAAVLLPALNFSDIVSGPKTGNTDGAGGLAPAEHGSIVTIWGNYLGESQGSSKLYFKDSSGMSHEVAHIYYWKNADGKLPGGPAELSAYHRMQEIAFSIPASAAEGPGYIYAVVNGVKSINGETGSSDSLPFTIRAGNIFFIREGGSDTVGDGSWNNSWASLEATVAGGNGKIGAGDIIYSVGVRATHGLSVGKNAQIEGTDEAHIVIAAYPGTQVAISGNDNLYYTIYYYYSNS